MEIVSNLQPKRRGLKVRTKGPRPSIFVRTFSPITKISPRHTDGLYVSPTVTQDGMVYVQSDYPGTGLIALSALRIDDGRLLLRAGGKGVLY